MRFVIFAFLLMGLVWSRFLPEADATVEVSPITGGTITTLTDATTIAWSANHGYAYQVTLGGNRAFANPSDVTSGTDYVILVTQGSGGSKIPTWGSAYFFENGVPPTLSTVEGSVDIVRFFSNGSTMLFESIATDITQTLLAPSAVTASTNQVGQVTVAWTDNSSNETNFSVECNEGLGYVTVTTEAANATSSVYATAAGTLSCRVKAKRGSGYSAASNTASGQVLSVLTPPSNLVAVGHVGYIRLTWTDNSDGEGGFVIEELVGSTWTVIVDDLSAETVTSDVDEGHGRTPGPGTFRVRAREASPTQVTAPSNTATAIST